MKKTLFLLLITNTLFAQNITLDNNYGTNGFNALSGKQYSCK